MSSLASNVPVSIIIPTLAVIERRHLLIRAVQSVLAASRREVKVLVCVNGSSWDVEGVAALNEMASVHVHHLPERSLPKAIAFGRALVDTEFFGFLDDDDCLLPGSIDGRLGVLEVQQDCDLAVGNGIRRTLAGDEIMLQLQTVSAEPLRTLFEGNWLPSCGALFRTATVGQRYFDDYHAYAEWTWLAYRLALDGKRVGVFDEPSFIVNDTAGSLSKSSAYQNAYLALYQRMLKSNPPPHIRMLVRRRMTRLLHDLSADRLQNGDVLESARLHLRSLFGPDGLCYLSYSRHILKAAVAGRKRRQPIA